MVATGRHLTGCLSKCCFSCLSSGWEKPHTFMLAWPRGKKNTPSRCNHSTLLPLISLPLAAKARTSEQMSARDGLVSQRPPRTILRNSNPGLKAILPSTISEIRRCNYSDPNPTTNPQVAALVSPSWPGLDDAAWETNRRRTLPLQPHPLTWAVSEESEGSTSRFPTDGQFSILTPPILHPAPHPRLSGPWVVAGFVYFSFPQSLIFIRPVLFLYLL